MSQQNNSINLTTKPDSTIELFNKLPFQLILDKILVKLNIREIFQFGQALTNYKNFRNAFMNWLFSKRIRNLIYKKMTSDSIFEFLAKLQIPDFKNKYADGLKRTDDYGANLIRKLMYDDDKFVFEDNPSEPFDFHLNYLSGILLEHLFNQQSKTPVTNLENYSIGLWIKMPGQDINKNEVSWTQKIFARLLSQAPKKIGIIYIQFNHECKSIILPDLFDEPLKNDPKNCQLYEYLMEYKLDTIDGQRKAAVVSGFITHLLGSFDVSQLRVRNFFFWKDEMITKIYTPTIIQNKNYLESLPLGLDLDPEDILDHYYDFINHFGLRKYMYNEDREIFESDWYTTWKLITDNPEINDYDAIWLGNLRNGYSSTTLCWYDRYVKNYGLENYEIYGVANHAHRKNENKYVIDENFIHQETHFMRRSTNLIDRACVERLREGNEKNKKSYMKLSAFDYYHDQLPADYDHKISGDVCFELNYDNILGNDHVDETEDISKIIKWPEPINNETILTNADCNVCIHDDSRRGRKLKLGLSELSLIDINLDSKIAERMLRCVYENDYRNLKKIEVTSNDDTVIYKKKALDNSELECLAREEKAKIDAIKFMNEFRREFEEDGWTVIP